MFPNKSSYSEFIVSFGFSPFGFHSASPSKSVDLFPFFWFLFIHSQTQRSWHSAKCKCQRCICLLFQSKLSNRKLGSRTHTNQLYTSRPAQRFMEPEALSPTNPYYRMPFLLEKLRTWVQCREWELFQQRSCSFKTTKIITTTKKDSTPTKDQMIHLAN